MEPDTSDLPLLRLEVSDRLLEAGQSYDIPFILKEGSKDLLSFQWMVNYDPAKIEISDI